MPTPKWKKGDPSPNPEGRPKKGYSITEMMRELMETTVTTKEGKEMSVREAIGKSILQKALKGDSTAQKLIWGYMDGMPMQKQEITAAEGSKITMEIFDYGSDQHKNNPTTETAGSSKDSGD